MQKYRFKLTGVTPLIQHADSIDWADAMTQWKNDPANRNKSVAGDDRTPAFRWIGCLWNDGERVVIPAEALAKSFMSAGAQVPSGKGKGTFKSRTASAIRLATPYAEFRCRGKEILMADITPLMKETEYDKHRSAVSKLGFELFAKRTTVGNSKHIRVRPRFTDWSCDGTLIVTDDGINQRVIEDIIGIAGDQKGLGDWRPSAPKSPGPFGIFKAEVSREA